MWVDGWFLGDFFWKVEGSSAHTCESHAVHVSHMWLTSTVINVHITTIWWRDPSRVAHEQLTCGN